MTTKIAIAPFIHAGNPNVKVTVQTRDGTSLQGFSEWYNSPSPNDEVLLGTERHNVEYTIWDNRRIVIEEMPR